MGNELRMCNDYRGVPGTAAPLWSAPRPRVAVPEKSWFDELRRAIALHQRSSGERRPLRRQGPLKKKMGVDRAFVAGQAKR